MNDIDTTDRLLAAWFELEAPNRAPDDLRTDIHHATARIRPRPAWLALLRGNPMDVIIGGARRREPRLVPILLLVGLLLAVVAAAAYIGAPRSEPVTIIPSPAISPNATVADPSPTLAAPTLAPLADTTITMPSTVTQLMVGDDAMWASVGDETTRELARTIHRIDPATNTFEVVVEDLPIGTSDHMTFVELNGSLWGSHDEADRSLRWDSTTGDLIGEQPLGDMPIDPVVAFGAVWHPNFRDGSVTRVDAETGAIAATVEIPQFDGEGPLTLTQGTDLLWALSPGAPVLVGIDPSSNVPVAEVALGEGLHCGVGASAGRLWVTGCDAADSVEIYDEASGDPVETIDGLPRVGAPIGQVGARVWLPALTDASEPTSRLVSIDPATLVRGPEIDLRVRAGWFWVAFDSVWFTAGTDVFRLSLDSLPSS